MTQKFLNHYLFPESELKGYAVSDYRYNELKTKVGMMKQIYKFLQVTLVGILLFAPQTKAKEQTTAKDVIETFNATLLNVMQKATILGFHGRNSTLEPVLLKTFDFPFMIEYAVGRSWKSFNEDQQKKLVKAFSRFTIATYADRFNGYSGESFRIVKAVKSPRNTRLIKTELTKKNGKAIRLNYLLRNTGKGWQIMDIFLKGSISELATKRSEYNMTVKRQGFDGLVSKINAKTAILQAQRPPK